MSLADQVLAVNDDLPIRTHQQYIAVKFARFTG